ncbi:MAG: glycoside hydrolase family 65 protein, partial [Rikenellaceae bacterium]|nr:glycoside hydrolase family 65 protein [Rikenellaceae bacterium]
ALTMRTKKTGFEVCWAQRTAVSYAGEALAGENVTVGDRVAERFGVALNTGDSVVLDKFVGVASSLNHDRPHLAGAACGVAEMGLEQGFEAVLEAHERAWAGKWEGCDVVIGGDDRAQQGIRFCIFQLLQTYTGRDSRLNVGPKGFTGEKYGGSTYWDTEAYCLPFYLCTSGETVARQLLLYRYHQLPQAIQNAEKLGFTDGAALYPMVTMTGEECHNEWEITFEEIHRNGAIAYAIYNFCRYTGTQDYLVQGGLEVLIGIARFWAQRATYSVPKGRYVILGVTGPNEYENNVNNNWYTNFLAAWCLRYAAEAARYVSDHDPEEYRRIAGKTGLNAGKDEFAHWREVAEGMFLPEWPTDDGDVFLQQEGYMDKEQVMAKEIPAAQRPINQHWSWDRILRSCFIKQADVLQGLYFFQELFDEATIARNFDFYEPRTVHESSLSPCVHSILASLTGRAEKAYELYLRTARLDLDDYNREVHEGLHITSMAGSWLSVIEGFGGVRTGPDGRLHVVPRLPEGWTSLVFKLHYRGAILKFSVSADGLEVKSVNGAAAEIVAGGTLYRIDNAGIQIKL